jgi:UDP-sugar transporter A1/2/3
MAFTADQLKHLLRNGWYTVAACILMTTQPFVTMLTKNTEGSYDYAPISTTFMAELVKLIISSCLYYRTAKFSHNALRTKEIIQFAVPAFVYFINNNLIFIILMYVSSTTYQILSALKTVATGILFRVILKRQLANVQKAAILLLACGAAVSQFPVCTPASCPEPLDLSQLIAHGSATGNATAILDQVLELAAEQARAKAEREASGQTSDAESGSAFIGVVVTLVACLNSAFAGVYSELLLKKDGSLHSIHLQNMLLYSWGVLFNLTAVFVKDNTLIFKHGFFAGYSGAVWLLITNNALNGLAISAILKFADNIVRVFAHTAAMLLTMVLELIFMGAPFSPQLLASITIVMNSTYLYNSKPTPPKVVEPRMQTLDEDTEINPTGEHGDPDAPVSAARPMRST